MNKIEGNYAEAKRLNLLKLKGQFMAMIMSMTWRRKMRKYGDKRGEVTRCLTNRLRHSIMIASLIENPIIRGKLGMKVLKPFLLKYL